MQGGLSTAIKDSAFNQWLREADFSAAGLTAEQTAVLQAAFDFRQQVGVDYYSTGLLSQFLLHCGSLLKIAHVPSNVRYRRYRDCKRAGLAS
jgi:hypothetical protein